MPPFHNVLPSLFLYIFQFLDDLLSCFLNVLVYFCNRKSVVLIYLIFTKSVQLTSFFLKKTPGSLLGSRNDVHKFSKLFSFGANLSFYSRVNAELCCLHRTDFIAIILQVPETLSDEVLGKMSAPPKSDVPKITPNELAEADGFVFGFPTRYGMMAAQFKAFLDATGSLWRTQQLAGKPTGIFYSTGSQGGGQETTA